jgi:tetratricopeptide (TPR) repeat protein
VLEHTLEHPLGVGRTTAHAEVREDLAELFALEGNYAAARSQYEQVVPLVRELGDMKQYALILERLGWVAREQGDSATAWLRMSESLALCRELGDPAYIAGTLTSMARIAIQEEDPARAEALLAESRALAQQGGVDRSTIFWTLNHLGNAAQLSENYVRAAQLHQESLSMIQVEGRAPSAASLSFYQSMGETTLGLGRLDEAAGWLAQGLAASQTLNEQPSIAWCLAGLGSAAALAEEPERAARLWGAAERLRQALGCRPARAARATYERALASARGQLGEEAFAAAWAAGHALTLEQAIAEACAASA